MSRIPRSVVSVALTAVLGVAAVPASAPAAPARVLAPAAVAGNVATFSMAGHKGARRGVVRAGGRRVRVLGRRALRKAERHGSLRVVLPRNVRAARARLLLARKPKPGSGGTSTGGTTTTTTSGTSGSTTTTTTTTTPTTTSTSGAGSVLGCGFGGFKAGAWPSDCWRPYSDSSPFNQSLGAGPKIDASSAAVVSRLAGFGTPQNLVAGTGASGDYEHPTFYSQPTDPVFTVHCLKAWGTCEVEGMQVRIPDAAKPASGGDGHMTVVDQAGGWEYDFWQVTSKPAGGGTISISWGGRTRIDGDGLDSNATAAMFGNLAGVIRAQELMAGRIDHALFMVVKCDSGKFVYPAMKSGRSCASIGLPTEGAPAMGQRFMLDMTDAQIDALAVPQWRKTIFKAMAHYGLYVGDTGTDSWGIQFESARTYTSFGVENPLIAWGRGVGAPSTSDGTGVVFNVRDGVDWASKLRVVDPCVAQGTCA